MPVRVVETVSASGADGSIEIVLERGPRVRVRGSVDPEALADVLAVLEAPPC
jgi:hypothetical protein